VARDWHVVGSSLRELGFADQARMIREFRGASRCYVRKLARQGALSDLFNTALVEEPSVPP